MSSGPADANATGNLQEAVWCEAYDLKEAVKRAMDGHRGLAIARGAIIHEINDALAEVGLRVVER